MVRSEIKMIIQKTISVSQQIHILWPTELKTMWIASELDFYFCTIIWILEFKKNV